MLGPVTSKPSGPPASGPAVEVPPHGEHWRPRVTVYSYPHPLLWVYLETGWALATVRARHDYPQLVAYQVELAQPNDDGTSSRVSRTYPWGKDNVRPVEEAAEDPASQ
jgi:hypothetical protein